MPALRVSENSIHSIGDEAQGRAVDAVAHAVGRLRIAGEHMTEMGVSGAASDSPPGRCAAGKRAPSPRAGCGSSRSDSFRGSSGGIPRRDRSF